MTLAELRAKLLARLNRDDCDAALAGTFIEEANARIGRELRVRFMETTATWAAGASPVYSFAVPADYAETIEVLVNDLPMDRTSYREMLRLGANGDAYLPRLYARQGGSFYLRGPIPVLGLGSLIYYAKPASLVADTDVNTVSENAPDLLLYAALSAAGDHFQHDKMGDWEKRYGIIYAELAAEKSEEELHGGPLAVSPMYYDPGT